MTHEELLAKIDELWYEIENFSEARKFKDALRAVVELHKPDHFCDAVDCIDAPGCKGCLVGNSQYAYPCPTIQAIQKELR